MRKELTVEASDGHTLGAYRANPASASRGGIIVLQEIFGVNRHIREVADSFAAEGYVAVAPRSMTGARRKTSSSTIPPRTSRSAES